MKRLLLFICGLTACWLTVSAQDCKTLTPLELRKILVIMEQSNSIHTISETQQRIIENLEKKAQLYNSIAESYHLDNKKLIRKNQELQVKVDRHKKLTLIATTTAVILGLILIF